LSSSEERQDALWPGTCTQICGCFHKLPEFQQITLKVLRWEERDKRLVIRDAEMVASTTW
jgi:hypothetical protein